MQPCFEPQLWAVLVLALLMYAAGLMTGWMWHGIFKDLFGAWRYLRGKFQG